MKNAIFIFVLSFLCFSAQAQTKLISHKSHSGSKVTFKTALDANLFDISESNFGAPGWFDSTSRLDSIVHVNDSIALVYRKSAMSGNWDEMRDEEKWKPFIDTLVHHELFSQKHALQDIRMRMRQYYEFRNWVDDVKFVGYDDELPEGEKGKFIPSSEIKTTPPQSYTPLDVKEPKECTKPKEKHTEKEEKTINQTPENNNRTSYNIKKEKPTPIFVATHTTETVKEASTTKESKTSSNIFMAVFGLVLLPVLLGFLFYKK
jgi:hypothetical protein